MLFETVHLPSAYERSSSSSTADYALLIGILREMSENCVVLIDDRRTISSAIKNAVKGWPDQYRQEASELLIQLHQLNRLVKQPGVPEPHNTCGKSTCALCCYFATRGADMYLSCSDCSSCSTWVTGKVTLARNYCLHAFSQRRKDAKEYVVPSKMWTKEEFAMRVWRPIFRHANYVHIIDRYVGRSAQQRGGRPKPSYVQTIEWMLEEALKVSTSGIDHVTLFGGCETNSRFCQETSNNWKQEAERIKSALDLPFQFSIEIVEERQDAEMPHNRYIFTDQIGISIDRGLDLLITDDEGKWIRDCHLKLIERPRIVEGEKLSEIDLLPCIVPTVT